MCCALVMLLFLLVQVHGQFNRSSTICLRFSSVPHLTSVQWTLCISEHVLIVAKWSCFGMFCSVFCLCFYRFIRASIRSMNGTCILSVTNTQVLFCTDHGQYTKHISHVFVANGQSLQCAGLVFECSSFLATTIN